MAEGSVGRLAAELIIDDKQAQQALMRFEKMAKASGLTVEEFTNRVSALGTQTVDASGKIEKGSTALRKWRQEQRLQNFVVREGTQALSGLAFAFAFLVQSGDEMSANTKRVSMSMLAFGTAMNATEFAIFGMSRALGASGAALAKLAGPIGIAVGAIALLVTWFQDLGKEADKTATKSLEGLDKKLEAISQKQVERTGEVIRADEKRLRRELEIVETRTDILEDFAKNRSDDFFITQEIARKAAISDDNALKDFLAKQSDALERARALRDEARLIAVELAAPGPTMGRRPLVPGEAKKIAEKIAEETARAQFEAQRAETEAIKRIIEANVKRGELNVAIATARAEQITDEERRLVALHDAEATRIRQEIEDETLRREQLAANRVQLEKDIGEIRKRELEKRLKTEQEEIEGALQGAQKLGAALSEAFGETSNFFRKISQFVNSIADLVRSINKLESKEGGGFGDILGTIASIIGIIGLFDEGGRIPGARGAPKLVLAHAGEMVLPTHKYPMGMALRKALEHAPARQTQFTDGGTVGTAGLFGDGMLLREIKGLRRDVRSLELQVNLVGPTARELLRKELPRAQRYINKKFPDGVR